MDGELNERESFALFGTFDGGYLRSDLLLAVFDTEEYADEAARGLVADTQSLLKYAFPHAIRFWFSPTEVKPEPTQAEWREWANGLRCVSVVRMTGPGGCRVVHSLVQKYDLPEEEL
jgi:hypothetical protein